MGRGRLLMEPPPHRRPLPPWATAGTVRRYFCGVRQSVND
jgi:hypothetical protein